MINEAIILLGGMGTRLLPYTKTVPKEMLPIYDVPNVYLLVHEAYLSGIKKIIFVVTEHNRKIIEHFFSRDSYLDEFLKDKPDKEELLKDINEIIDNVEFVYVYQELKGTYGAVYSAKDYVTNDNFIIMYGDDLIDNDIPLTKQLIDKYMIKPCMYVALKERASNNLPNVGIIKLDQEDNIIDIVDKKSNHSNCELHGRMLLNKKIFTIKDQLQKHANDEYYLPYALLNFIGEVKGLKYQGKYFNIGEKTGYIKASIHYAMKNEKEKDNIINFIKEEINGVSIL